MDKEVKLRTFIMEPTGEYRRPKKQEWFIGLNEWPTQTSFDMDHEYPILSITIKSCSDWKNSMWLRIPLKEENNV